MNDWKRIISVHYNQKKLHSLFIRENFRKIIGKRRHEVLLADAPKQELKVRGRFQEVDLLLSDTKLQFKFVNNYKPSE